MIKYSNFKNRKMRHQIKRFLTSLLPKSTVNDYRKKRQKKLLVEWERNGCPNPPPHLVKQKAIKEYKDKYNYNILVETGIYLGDMVEAQKSNFDKLFSIELGADLFKNAKKRFKDDKNVFLELGDSGKVLRKVLQQIDEPAIFWLDGHYSAGITAKGEKECPIFEELDSIFDSKNLNHVLLIDDARCFVGEGDYPTIDKLTEYVKSKDERYNVEVKHDIIRYSI